MFVEVKDAMTCDGVDGSAVRVLVLSLVLLAIWVLTEVRLEVATKWGGVASDLAVLDTIPNGYMLGSLLWGGGGRGLGCHPEKMSGCRRSGWGEIWERGVEGTRLSCEGTGGEGEGRGGCSTDEVATEGGDGGL